MGEDGNVTAALVPHKPFTAAHLKSIHLSAAVVDSSFHTAVCDICLLKGYKISSCTKSHCLCGSQQDV